MSATIEMFRNTAAPNRFSCPLDVWELLYELGRAFGWRPVGTTYVIAPQSTVESPARRNYEPGSSRDQKLVGEVDAMAWARALEKAMASSHLAAMIEARSLALASNGKVYDELLPGVIDEFIEFAFGGAFEFAIRRGDAPRSDADGEQ